MRSSALEMPAKHNYKRFRPPFALAFRINLFVLSHASILMLFNTNGSFAQPLDIPLEYENSNLCYVYHYGTNHGPDFFLGEPPLPWSPTYIRDVELLHDDSAGTLSANLIKTNTLEGVVKQLTADDYAERFAAVAYIEHLGSSASNAVLPLIQTWRMEPVFPALERWRHLIDIIQHTNSHTELLETRDRREKRLRLEAQAERQRQHCIQREEVNAVIRVCPQAEVKLNQYLSALFLSGCVEELKMQREKPFDEHNVSQYLVKEDEQRRQQSACTCSDLVSSLPSTQAEAALVRQMKRNEKINNELKTDEERDDDRRPGILDEMMYQDEMMYHKNFVTSAGWHYVQLGHDFVSSSTYSHSIALSRTKSDFRLDRYVEKELEDRLSTSPCRALPESNADTVLTCLDIIARTQRNVGHFAPLVRWLLLYPDTRVEFASAYILLGWGACDSVSVSTLARNYSRQDDETKRQTRDVILKRLDVSSQADFKRILREMPAEQRIDQRIGGALGELAF